MLSVHINLQTNQSLQIEIDPFEQLETSIICRLFIEDKKDVHLISRGRLLDARLTASYYEMRSGEHVYIVQIAGRGHERRNKQRYIRQQIINLKDYYREVLRAERARLNDIQYLSLESSVNVQRTLTQIHDTMMEEDSAIYALIYDQDFKTITEQGHQVSCEPLPFSGEC